MTSYNVSSTGKVDCTTASGSDAPHGLWTNRYQVGAGSVHGGCGQYFNFSDDSTLDVDGSKARLSATATNPYGVTADIDFVFRKPLGLADWEKTGGKVKGADLGDESKWTFYELGKGRINVTQKHSIGNIDIKVVDHFRLDLKDDTAFQFGVGANDKTGAMGASGWLDINLWARTTLVYKWDKVVGGWASVIPDLWGHLYDWKLGDHWDLNMELSAVPLPSSLVLFISGLLALAGFNSRKRSSAKMAVAA
ncbi:MAG: hypothetical protein AAF918_05430 [Pseudomonadota bacterium]